MAHKPGTASPESLFPSVNFAIGPSCPVRCEGCYNFFGDTAKTDTLISGPEVIGFAEAVRGLGVRRTVVSGGDPLTHPEILKICDGLTNIMEYVRLDTVGTSLLDEPDSIPVLYKGVPGATMPRYSPSQFKGKVTLINIPIDGKNQDTALQFRKGRPHSLDEAKRIGRSIVAADVKLGVNTVVNAANIDELGGIRDIVRDLGACQWRLFQFDPEGPNPSRQRHRLTIGNTQFKRVTDSLRVTEESPLQILAGGLDNRGSYCMINDSGMLYMRATGSPDLDQIGHITHDRDAVIGHMESHIAAFAMRDIPVPTHTTNG